MHLETRTFAYEKLCLPCPFDKITPEVVTGKPLPDPKSMQALLAFDGEITAINQAGGTTLVTVSPGTFKRRAANDWPVQTFEDKKLTGMRITGFDPTTPIGSWKKAWGKLTAKAGLSGLRFHDLRHNAITELLTNPAVSVQTTKSIAGHVSQRMIDRYAHIRLEAKRSALDTLSTLNSGNSSNQVTGNSGNTGNVSNAARYPVTVIDSVG